MKYDSYRGRATTAGARVLVAVWWWWGVAHINYACHRRAYCDTFWSHFIFVIVKSGGGHRTSSSTYLTFGIATPRHAARTSAQTMVWYCRPQRPSPLFRGAAARKTSKSIPNQYCPRAVVRLCRCARTGKCTYVHR